MTSLTTENQSFNGLGIAPKILEILDKLKFITPTPIQRQSIPSACEGKDIMGVAQTGTGKTLAFGIPMIQRLAQMKGSQGLVILPTRELAVQVNESLLQIGQSLGLKTTVLIGGEPANKQLRSLRQNPRIIIATPGRLNDHLEQKNIKLDKVKLLVLDEADRMLDMGFVPQINRIVKNVPRDRQTMLFSATMPQAIINLATSYMKLPIRVEVAPSGTISQKVTQEVFFVNHKLKLQLLEKVLTEYRGSVLIFSRTKHAARKIARALRNMEHSATEIHSNRSLNQRLEAMSGFKLGKYRVLVATDIAARGIDVTGIELVVNYDLPANPEDYVHRIGRTARAGHQGHATSFATPDQSRDVRDIERLIKTQLLVSPLPKLPEKRALPKPETPFKSSRPYARKGANSPRGRARNSSNRSSGNFFKGNRNKNKRRQKKQYSNY